jgi:RNA polymerase sigma factor (TIGR02999 family)
MRRAEVLIGWCQLHGLRYPIPRAYDAHEVSDVTRLLDAVEHGEPQAAEELLPLVYDELRRLATHKMANEKPGQTLQATALVHEAWLRLVGQDQQHYRGRRQFFGAASEAMRRILVDRARRRRTARHGGTQERVPLEAAEIACSNDELILRVHEALDRLAREDPERAEVVKLRFFVGLGNQEAANVLQVNERTVRRHWNLAKAWLYEAMQRAE